jgi:hypothetical protein
MRGLTRWVLVGMAIVAMILVIGAGPKNTIRAAATPPDVYSVTAGSSAADTRAYQTGSPVDPAPAVNTAIPLTSVIADNQPQTSAHAAYLEPPTTAQAATNLNNVPVPYPTQVDALCANCSSPLNKNADGNVDQPIDGSRVALSGGHAHAEAAPTQALAQATVAQQTLGPLDQLTNFYNAIVSDLYAKLSGPPPVPLPVGGTPPPAPCPSPPLLCTSALPAVSVLAQTGPAQAQTKIDAGGSSVVVDTSSSISGTRLLDGLITIATIHTDVATKGDGTAAGTSIKASNDVSGVKFMGQDFTLTADGLCHIGEQPQLCKSDPVNTALHNAGFNVCRLSTLTSPAGSTMVTGNAEGVLVEWHARTVNGQSAPDPKYYDTFGDRGCEYAPPAPHADFSGMSAYVVLGESSAQSSTQSFPGCTTCLATLTGPIGGGDQGGGQGSIGFSAVPPSNGAGGGGQSKPATTNSQLAVSSGLFGIRDRRPLLLTVFGLLELILLSNLTAMALSRRQPR